MSTLEFEEDNFTHRMNQQQNTSADSEQNWLIRFLIGSKLAKDARSAEIEMMIFTAGCIVLALFIFFFFVQGQTSHAKLNLSSDFISGLPQDVQQRIYYANHK